jgi:Secretion system C-terminal sorting domain
MKSVKILLLALISLSVASISFAQAYIEITYEEIEIEVGESIQLDAAYFNDEGEEVDTLFTWDVHPLALGTIDTNAVFFAEHEGTGTITATLGDLTDSVDLTVEEGEEDPNENLYLTPGDTTITVGSSVQYTAWNMNNEIPEEVAATWSLEGSDVGTVSETGLLETSTSGFAFVTALTEFGTTNSLVLVEEEADTAGTNSITITRESPNPNGFNVMATITEGESWTIGGLPHPMNVLNGGMIYFPQGSLHEDIRLHIELPGFAHDDGDSISYGQNIISGVDFHVMVEDTIVTPYYFDTPLFVGLVFKRGLLNHLGIDPQDLALYFAIEQGDTLAFDTTGISNTVVDSVRNRIFSNVAHFSSLVIAPSTDNVDVDEFGTTLPSIFEIHPAYPNPFNPTTNISFDLKKAANTQIAVYNANGQLVATLVDGFRSAGYHNLSFDGSELASGVYFVRMKANNFTKSQKLILMK